MGIQFYLKFDNVGTDACSINGLEFNILFVNFKRLL